MIEGYYRIRI